MTPDQIQLTRLCAERIVRNHANGVKVDPHSLEWARDFLVFNPKRPITGNGEPSRARVSEAA